MKYVISLFAGTVGERGYYARDNGNGTWDEIYDPSKATVYTSGAKAKEWYSTNTTFAEYCKVVPLSAELVEYEKFMADGGVRRSFETVDQSLSRPYNKNTDTKEDVLEFRWKTTHSGNSQVRHEDWRTWPPLYTLFKHIFEVSGYHDYNDDGKVKKTFSLYTSQTGKFEDFEREINLVLDRVEYIDRNGWKTFNVFDHYLSEGGNTVYLKEKDGAWKVSTRLDGLYDTAKPQPLVECFEYLRTSRYYNTHD